MSDDQNPLNPQKDTTLGVNNSVSDDPQTPPPTTSNEPAIAPASMQNTGVLENTQTATPSSDSYDNSTQLNQEEIVTSPHTPKKYGGNKVIATIFGVLVLVGGITAGVVLVQRQQLLEQEAASGRECQQAPDCILLDEEKNTGSFTAPAEIVKVDITARFVHSYQPGLTEDGCYRVRIEGRDLAWQRYGSGPDCKDVSNVQVWIGQTVSTPTTAPTDSPEPTPTTPPGITTTPSISAECGDVKAYNTNWEALTQTQLNGLSSGTRIRFAVSGTTTSGSFDKAKFNVNSVDLGETTLKKPGSDDFYIEYTIPANTTSFTVSAQIHHTQLGWF